MDTISLGLRRKARPKSGWGLVALVGLWLERSRSRRQLQLLLVNPQVLADLGLTREEADQESIKPFWR